jgi:hypothetical protein
VVLGLPGESAEDCLEVIQLASKTALEAKIRHVRFALWPGEEKSIPENVGQMQELFLANHPSWHPVEYRGIHDFLALMNETLQHTKVVGPEFSPDWNETEAVIPD